MNVHGVAERIGGVAALDGIAEPVAATVKRVIGRGPLKDLLSGTWLGHPAHPLLTDIPIGSFTSASVLDFVGGKRAQPAADALVALGVVSALPTAAAGAADWSETQGPDRRTGVVHASLNLFGVALYAASLLARRRGHRAAGKVLALAGMTTMSGAGYLGGYLSYTRGVGVNNAFLETPPGDWTAVHDEDALPLGKPVAVHADGATVLLYKTDSRILAIGGRCSHAGGPLAEGTLDEHACTVECPWHQSVFRLDDGTVVHGPAAVPEPAYDVRVRDGAVEVRVRTSG